MHVFLVQVDVIVGPLQGAEFQYLILGNMGRFLRAFLLGLFAACGRLHIDFTSLCWALHHCAVRHLAHAATLPRAPCKRRALTLHWSPRRLRSALVLAFWWETSTPTAWQSPLCLETGPTTMLHLEEMHHVFISCSSRFKSLTRWDVYNLICKTHSPCAQI